MTNFITETTCATHHMNQHEAYVEYWGQRMHRECCLDCIEALQDMHQDYMADNMDGDDGSEPTNEDEELL